MSEAPVAAPKGLGTRLVQAIALAVVFALLFGATRAVPQIHGEMGAIAAVGFLLLAGTLMSELLETFGLPHVSGYLAAGVVAGPYVLHLLDHATVERLTSINGLALALIAFAGGAELELGMLRASLRSLVWATIVQTLLVLTITAGVFVAVRPMMPFLGGVPLAPLVGIGLLWGMLAVTRSPSALLGILSQTRASGPVTTNALAFVMTSDVVVVVLAAVVMALARPLIEPGDSVSLAGLSALGHELLGSVALGTTLGLCLAAYMRLVGTQLVLIFVALGVGASEILEYLHFEPLLAFMVAGFVVQNLSRQGKLFLRAIEETGGVVYVVFFATAGAHLDLPMVRRMWLVALVLCGARAIATFVASRLASDIAKDPPVVKKWGWASLVAQAGLTLGIVASIARAYPQFGEGFRALAIATIAINQVVGPILFKIALDRAGESKTGEAMRANVTNEEEAA
jgi:Kef-type K+ transport system membrane component KefB